MGGWGSASYQQADSQQQSSSRTGLRGTGYQGNAEQQTNEQGMQLSNFANQMASSPGAMMGFGKQMIDGGKYGLGANADSGVEQYGADMFNKYSASGASKGQMSPENQSGVIGSAIQNSLGTLIPQQQAMQLAQFNAPMNLLNTARTSADFWNRALGAQSDASGSSNSFGFSVAGGGGA